MVELPYKPKAGGTRGIPPAFGCYNNHLKVDQLVVVPRYGLLEDAEVLACLQEAISGPDVRSIDCTGLSMEGGVLTCATWTVLAGMA